MSSFSTACSNVERRAGIEPDRGMQPEFSKEARLSRVL